MPSTRSSSRRRTILRDVSSLHNSSPTRSSSLSSRRKSIGGADLRSMMSGSSPQPKKDRRALLEEWRKQKLGGDNSKTSNQPPLPPSSSHTSSSPHLPPMSTRSPMMINSGQFNDENQTIDLGQAGLSAFSGRNPSSRRRLGGPRRRSLSASAALREPSPSTLPESSPSALWHSSSPSRIRREGETLSKTNNTTNEKHIDSSLISSTSEDVPTVEDAGLRSQVREMQQRVDQLEKEKIVLSMAKAPLETRFRQKEDEWLKEQNKLFHEVDSLKKSLREGDERYRDLEIKHDALNEECKKLRMQVLKASSTLKISQQSDNSSWSRRLQNDRDVAEIKEKLRNAEEEINACRLEKVSVEKELHAMSIELDSVSRDYEDLREEYEEIVASKAENKEAEIKLKVLTTEHIATSAQLNAVCADLAATKATSEATIYSKEEEHKKEVSDLQFEINVLKTRAAIDDSNDKSLSAGELEDTAVLKTRVEHCDKRIAELEAQLRKGEELRRKQHNQIQELRGNIRVFVRTRPFLPGDGQANDSAIDFLPDGESVSIIDQRSKNDQLHDFKFDKVFPPSAGQDLVFEEVADFVQSALDGYNVCLFSYGQTGSGKTHTMQGSGNGVMRGIIPRAVEQILSQAKSSHSGNWKFKLSASFLEIYNEKLNDLLFSMEGGKRNKAKPKLAVKRNQEGKSYVEGLTKIKIETDDTSVGMEQLDSLMDVASRSRSVACTNMNSQSSRSHSVFILHLNGFNEDNGAVVQGALNLCDLAGSERLDRSGAASDATRLRETQAINKSLSCLGDVFNALAQGSKHVPYRNSKLTYLLQDCLSGDGKALMFVNLSPTIMSSSESLCSLRFAQRVNKIELGKPTKHIQYDSSSNKRRRT